MSLSNSVIKSLESDRTKLNTKIAKLYAKRQKLVDQLNSQIYYTNGQKEWDGIREAARGIGAKSHKHISCCCKGTEKTAQGFKWEYKHG